MAELNSSVDPREIPVDAKMINFLMPKGGQSATKTFQFNPITKSWEILYNYKAGKFFKGFAFPTESLSDVYQILKENQDFPVFFIHGGFIDGIDRTNMVRRKREGSKDDLQPTLRDRMVHCFCLDIDGYEGNSVEEFVNTQLPDAFSRADYIYQYSASYGLSSDQSKLKVHLFFWLQNPCHIGDLKTWVKSYNSKKGWGNVIDDSVLTATQPVYTQRRICKGADDPIQDFIGYQVKGGVLNWQPDDNYVVKGKAEGNLEGILATAKETEFDVTTSIREIVAGKRFHENVRSMSLSLMNDGIPPNKVKKTIKGILQTVETKDERWQTRYDDVDRLVETAAEIVNKPTFEEMVDWIKKSQTITVEAEFAEKIIKFDPIQQKQLVDYIEEKLGVGKRAINAVMKIAKAEHDSKQIELARQIQSEKRAAMGILEFEITSDNHGDTTRKISQALSTSEKTPQVFMIGKTLSIVLHNYPKTVRQVMRKQELGEDYPKMPLIQDITKPVGVLRGIVEKDCAFINETGKGIVCPDSILNAVPRCYSVPWKSITGIVEHPFIGMDWEIVQKQGYDESTGLYAMLHDKLKIKLGDPGKAYQYLAYTVFDEFPFDTDLDRACAVGCLLTAIQRPIIAGETGIPGFAMVSPKPSSGKTTLVQLICHSVYNRPAAATGWSDSDEELGKHLLAILREGHSSVLFDNIPKSTAIKSDELAKAMTSATYSRRKLGENETEEVPSNVLWLFTGNNIQFKGDFATRILPIRIVPEVERPEHRVFSRGDIGQWAADNRKKILSAALSIIISGKDIKDDFVGTASRFKEWNKYVRLPLLKVCGHDLLSVFERNSFEDDDFIEKRELLEALYDEFGEKAFKTRDVLKAIGGYNETGKMDSDGSLLKEIITDVFGEKAATNPKALGRYLLGLKDFVIGPYKLQRGDKKLGVNWKVRYNPNCKIESVETDDLIVGCEVTEKEGNDATDMVGKNNKKVEALVGHGENSVVIESRDKRDHSENNHRESGYIEGGKDENWPW